MTDVRGPASTRGLLADETDLVWVDRQIDNHAVIVHVAGEVDLVTCTTMEEQLRMAQALVSPPAPVVLDLTATVFFGAAGLALLEKYTSRCAAVGSRLCVVADHQAVLRPITITGLNKVVDVVSTVARALDAGRTRVDGTSHDGHRTGR